MLRLFFKRTPCLSFTCRGLKDRAGKSVKPGVALVLDGVPYKVTKIIQGKRGKGGGYVRAFMKNLEASGVIEKTFTSDELVEFADLEQEAVSARIVICLTDPCCRRNIAGSILQLIALFS